MCSSFQPIWGIFHQRNNRKLCNELWEYKNKEPLKALENFSRFIEVGSCLQEDMKEFLSDAFDSVVQENNMLSGGICVERC